MTPTDSSRSSTRSARQTEAGQLIQAFHKSVALLPSQRAGRASARHPSLRAGSISVGGLSTVYCRCVKSGGFVAVGALATGLTLAGCGAGSSSPSTSPSPSPSTTATPAASATTAVVPTTASGTTTSATCPTLAQANAALGATYNGPISTPTPGGGVVCEYTGGPGNAGVTIFAHQPAAVFAGQVTHAPVIPPCQASRASVTGPTA